MRSVGFCDHLRGKAMDVVRAEKPPRSAGCERGVEQRFVTLALDHLNGGAVGPDRLANAAQTKGGRVSVDKILPGRNDSRWVGPDLGHVGELNLVRVPA